MGYLWKKFLKKSIKNIKRKYFCINSKNVKIMKNFLILVILLIAFTSCKSKKNIENTDNLPKDISLKPDNKLAQQQDKDKMSALLKEIETPINAETCTDVSQWKFSPIGSKPCGGAVSYIAYPVKMETEILAKIKNFTEMQSAFNTKYGIISDCAIVAEPTEIKCENGKAVLLSGNSLSN